MKTIAAAIAISLSFVWTSTVDAMISRPSPVATVDTVISLPSSDAWELELEYDRLEYELEMETGDFILNYEGFDESRIGDTIGRQIY
jgi:hypothetical protein